MKFHDFQQAHSESVVALRALSQSVAAKGMDKVLLELVKIRASQVNGCAYCAQFHINLARKQGCSQSKLDQLAVWRDRSEEHTSELQSLMRISYAVFCLNKKP